MIVDAAMDPEDPGLNPFDNPPKRPKPNADIADVYRAYLDAVAIQDREKLRALVVLPADEQRRERVLSFTPAGEPPPPDVKRPPPTVTMDGPVAVCHVIYWMPDGSTKPAPPGFLVRRDGRWKVVVDDSEAGGLTLEELEVIKRSSK